MVRLLIIIYIQLYSSFNDSKEKKTKTDNKQETETRLNINSHINHIKSFRSRHVLFVSCVHDKRTIDEAKADKVF